MSDASCSFTLNIFGAGVQKISYILSRDWCIFYFQKMGSMAS